MNVLSIPKGGSLDFLALGALVHRLDPGIVPFRKASRFDVHVSGGEFNVAGNLRDCFGVKTGIASAIVGYPIGDLVGERVRAMGVTSYFKHFEHDGVCGPTIATVYSDRGFGVRGPAVFYNRSNEAAALLRPGDFDWDRIFGEGVRWFHSGGIFASLSASTADLLIEAMEKARQYGAVCSFDLNYREKLWNVSGGLERGREVLRRIVRNADVVVGNEEDLQLGLGITEPASLTNSKLDPCRFLALISDATRLFPNIKLVATTLRDVESANRHRWSAVAWTESETCTAPVCSLDVYDRVGGGDGFAAGLFYGLLSGCGLEEAVKLGWAHGALVTTFPGDTTMSTLADVRAFAAGRSARIRR